ncbi:MAG: hypothetical protein IJE14_03345 [Clostridia bacterium]|nr:hypothetical protein [Clostridia bacterium]
MKEKLQPNDVEATLFVGLGGIGSKIIKGVRERCKNDNLKNVQFVTMDTDVNDLERLEEGPEILSIQTSSSRSVAAYLRNDRAAKEEWFPENKILDGKTVSEGAGQVRAISRLALNATIKQGRISVLYKAIDDLFLKDGGNKSRAVRVVIASTASGGTGSGITLPLAMLIRQYLKKNYPESAAVIRGFIVMPSVLDTVVESENEKNSQRRNGYATIKEINAFMMKASGAFDYDPRLRRYKDLHIKLPTTASADEKISNLPFDFCFLIERIDGNQKNMESLKQYQDYAAQCIYEQNIGPLKSQASSKEDNIIKEFSNTDKHGRNRFGGAGAAIIRYPYEEIRDYIAYDWAQNAILGLKSVKDLTDEQREEAACERSWMIYDYKFDKAFKVWQNDPKSTEENKPELRKHYIDCFSASDADEFTKKMQMKYIQKKIDMLKEKSTNASDDANSFRLDSHKVAKEYYDSIVEAVKNEIGSNIMVNAKNSLKNLLDKHVGGVKISGNYVQAYNELEAMSKFTDHTQNIKKNAEECIKNIFEKEDVIGRDKGAHLLSNFLSDGDRAMHPNAVRFLLYVLLEHLEEKKKNNPPFDRATYEEELKKVYQPEDTEKLKVMFGGAPDSVKNMCKSLDDLYGIKATLANIGNNADDAKKTCMKELNKYRDKVVAGLEQLINSVVIEMAYNRIDALCRTYEKFYRLFGTKAYGLEKKREEIADKLTNKTGSCVHNLFGSRNLLETLSEKAVVADNEEGENELYKTFYRAMRDNTEISEMNSADKFSKKTEIDVFNDIIIKSFKDSVDACCADIIDLDILRAMKLEHETKYDYKLSQLAADREEEKSDLKKLRDKPEEVLAYINKLLRKGRNLAAPSISKNDFEEEREVSAVAYSKTLTDFGNVEINKLFEEKNAAESVSRYELHFFRSIYGLTPIQISKMCSPEMSKEELAKCVDISSIDGNVEIGDYFVNYQEYMENIGPDCKLNALITPHIDKSWNSISVMPELDLEYQSHLMQDIHQAFFYGFLFDIIELYQPSVYDSNTWAYRFFDINNNARNFTVSNGTPCDKFDEVLDGLYFDRAAVKAIKKMACANRTRDRNSRTSFDKTIFFNALGSLSREKMVGEITSSDAKLAKTLKTSMFEIPLMYYNSLMISDDMDEIIAMVKAIINAVKYQLSSKERGVNLDKHVAQLVVEHHNLLLENYVKLNDFLAMGVEIHSNEAMISIHKFIKQYVDRYLPNGNDLKSLDEYKTKKN